MSGSAASVEIARGGAAARDRAVAAGESVSFAELVWAHFLRQREVHEHGILDGPAERDYRRRLEQFELQHGQIVNAYWCSDEASAAALTAKPGRRVLRLWHAHPILRLHAVTDWSTDDAPEVARLLHLCDTLAIRVGEVLRGTSERIALQWLLSTVSHLLGFVDSAKRRPNERQARDAVKATLAELERIEAYYDRAGSKVARILYAEGMFVGFLVLAGLTAAAVAIAAHVGLHLDSPVTQNVLITMGMGAAGALVSVMSRMASGREGSFTLDYEVGRPLLRFLGGVRPFVGSLLALVLYFSLLGDLLQLGPSPSDQSTAFYAAVAFLAGFSERSAKVLLGGAERVLGPAAAGDAPQPKPSPASAPARTTDPDTSA